MDFLHTQLSTIQRQLAFVSVDPIDWKLYVQAFSWTVALFESYLLYLVPFLFECSLTLMFFVLCFKASAVPPIRQDRATSCAR